MSGCMVCVWFACECVCVHAYAYVWCVYMRVYGVSVNECACVCEFVILYACMDVCVIHALGNTPPPPSHHSRGATTFLVKTAITV